MSTQAYRYLIVGGGLAGGYAVQGIRERDKDGSVLLIGRERHLPYERPPLSKKLWTGKKQLADVYVKDRAYYEQNGVRLLLGESVTAVDRMRRVVTTASDQEYGFSHLLLATGGQPRRLTIPGGDLQGLIYYRYLDDYLFLRDRAGSGHSVAVIGGGFIGSEVAAALAMNQTQVTMLFPEPYLGRAVFPEALGRSLTRMYEQKGIRLLAQDPPVAIERRGAGYAVRSAAGQVVEAETVVIGIGITPDVSLAQAAGLNVSNGIEVDQFLRTSDDTVFAAGDNAFFPYLALGERRRVEHWDNALAQGQRAGRNMTGAEEPYDHMPYFFSDLFEFGYEAVGDVDARLQTFADWQKENDTGVVYYLKDGVLRGAMMCNVWDKVPVARDLIRRGGRVSPEELRGAIG
jgi:3-phenylpropionate/trans-cinnamate dioxygenase ferredoxin reductase component